MRVDSRDFTQWKILTGFSLLHPCFHSQVSFRMQMVNQLLCAVVGERGDAAFSGEIPYFLLLHGWMGVSVTQPV